ncbi:MAG: ImmA/IrrE family metallo-endopeptidase [candidate division NC10 bacterium]|nr:ImmA/IrrE family metallo-endopeptidase [candidate division NC10 bacterium]MBI2563327.1 ImmA/IrrE family metallo-endopeptidase [candidate division NC10 bacterium]
MAELERRAEELLRSRCGWPPAIPVDIETLVDQEPRVLLDILPGLQKLCGIAGHVRYEPETDTLRLIIDAEVADHPAASFYRFTVAEELAHVLLHRAIVAQVRTLKDSLALHAWRGYHEIDRNAKRLAAALLMPTISVAQEARRLYPDLVKVAGFGDPSAVQAHLEERLARLHAVSASAMRNRLKEWPLRLTQKIERAMRERLTVLE